VNHGRSRARHICSDLRRATPGRQRSRTPRQWSSRTRGSAADNNDDSNGDCQRLPRPRGGLLPRLRKNHRTAKSPPPRSRRSRQANCPPLSGGQHNPFCPYQAAAPAKPNVGWDGPASCVRTVCRLAWATRDQAADSACPPLTAAVLSPRVQLLTVAAPSGESCCRGWAYRQGVVENIEWIPAGFGLLESGVVTPVIHRVPGDARCIPFRVGEIDVRMVDRGAAADLRGNRHTARVGK
jgi:hypothetical protein